MEPITTAEPATVAPGDAAGSEPSTAKLVSGMASDVKRLGEEYIELMRLELARTVRTTSQLVAAGMLAVLGAALLAVGVAMALHENTDLSRGDAYAVVGAVLATAGLIWSVVATAVRRAEKT